MILLLLIIKTIKKNSCGDNRKVLGISGDQKSLEGILYYKNF